MWSRVRSIAAGVFLTAALATAEEIRIAVAANFHRTAEEVAARFEETTGHRVTLIPGSTGKHYAQIRNGAPFDVFLAADWRHPRLLEEGGLAVPGYRFTYAMGELVLWSPIESLVDPRGDVLRRSDFRHLAIANPDLAPYGVAAREVLQALGLWGELGGRTVRGENVSQAFQFVASGNAELGFVALSQIVGPEKRTRQGSHWRIPAELYAPIAQQSALLTDKAAAKQYLEFLRSEQARRIIREHGYRVAEDEND